MLPVEIMNRACGSHQEFRKRIAPARTAPYSADGGVLRKIQQSDPELLRFALGDFGTSVSRFVGLLDLEHPESESVRDFLFGGEPYFSDKFLQFLGVAEYAWRSGLHACFPFLGSSMVKEYMSQGAQRKVQDGQIARCFVRAMKDGSDRDRLRRSKKTQPIDLQALWKKGDDLWSSLPDDFSRFLRFDSAYEDDLAQAVTKMKRYEELGCTTLASEMQATINLFRETMQQSYYGFNRVTMTNAAVVLAKFHGYRFVAERNITFGGVSCTGSSRVEASQDAIGDYVFSVDESSTNPAFVYQPKVYCYHSMEDLASEEIRSTVCFLESFPEANGKPIFDHFGVIVPSVTYNGMCLRDSSGLIHKFSDQQEVSCALDRSLVKTKSVVPILVGERDNKCYFITYWV